MLHRYIPAPVCHQGTCRFFSGGGGVSLTGSRVSGEDVLPCWQPCAELYRPGTGCWEDGESTAGEGLLVEEGLLQSVRLWDDNSRGEKATVATVAVFSKKGSQEWFNPTFRKQLSHWGNCLKYNKWKILTSTRGVGSYFGKNHHLHQRMNPADFDDPLTFALAPSSGQNLTFQ